MTISFDDFLKVDIRCGTVVDVEPFERARNPSYKVKVDFGEAIGIKQTSAQVTHHYSPKDLLGKKIIAVVNFPPKNIAGFQSEFLLLGCHDENNHVFVAELNKNATDGSRLS